MVGKKKKLISQSESAEAFSPLAQNSDGDKNIYWAEHTDTSLIARLKSKRTFLTKVAVMLVGLLLVVGGGLLVYRHRQNAVGNACSTPDKQSLRQQASSYIADNKLDDLDKLVTNIQNFPKFDRDPNCLYIVVRYYINVGDSEFATKYLDMLTAVYDPSRGYSEDLLRAVEPTALRREVDAMHQYEADTRANTFGVTPDNKGVRGGY